MLLIVRNKFLAVVDRGNWEVKFQGDIFTSGADGIGNDILFGITNQGHLIWIYPMLLALELSELSREQV